MILKKGQAHDLSNLKIVFSSLESDFNCLMIFLATCIVNPAHAVAATNNFYLLNLIMLKNDYSRVVIKFLTNDDSAKVDIQTLLKTTEIRSDLQLDADKIFT